MGVKIEVIQGKRPPRSYTRTVEFKNAYPIDETSSAVVVAHISAMMDRVVAELVAGNFDQRSAYGLAECTIGGLIHWLESVDAELRAEKAND